MDPGPYLTLCLSLSGQREVNQTLESSVNKYAAGGGRRSQVGSGSVQSPCAPSVGWQLWEGEESSFVSAQCSPLTWSRLKRWLSHCVRGPRLSHPQLPQAKCSYWFGPPQQSQFLMWAFEKINCPPLLLGIQAGVPDAQLHPWVFQGWANVQREPHPPNH